MAGWLEIFLLSSTKHGIKSRLPARRYTTATPSVRNTKTKYPHNIGLPNATIIYGIGAAFMFVAGLFLLIAAHWFPALMVFILGGGLLGFALHFMKYHN